MPRSNLTALRATLSGASLFLVVGGVSGADAQTTDQGFPLDAYRMAPLATDGFALPRPFTLRRNDYSARMALDYGFRPLSFEGPPDYDVVRHEVGGTLALAFAATERVSVTMVLPVQFLMKGDAPPRVGMPSADGTLASDPLIGVRARLLGVRGDRFVLGGQLEFSLPLANATVPHQRYTGDESVVFRPTLTGEVMVTDDLHLNVVVGGRFRSVAHSAYLTVGQEFVFGAGATYEVLEDRLDLIAEVYGATDFGRLPGRGNSPAELLVGTAFHAQDKFHLGAAIGTGFTSGYGASDVRALITAGFAHAREPRFESLPSTPPGWETEAPLDDEIEGSDSGSTADDETSADEASDADAVDPESPTSDGSDVEPPAEGSDAPSGDDLDPSAETPPGEAPAP